MRTSILGESNLLFTLAKLSGGWGDEGKGKGSKEPGRGGYDECQQIRTKEGDGGKAAPLEATLGVLVKVCKAFEGLVGGVGVMEFHQLLFCLFASIISWFIWFACTDSPCPHIHEPLVF